MFAITQKITKILEVFLIILMSTIVIDVTWQVITRFILQDPSAFTEELAGFLLIWIGLLGASYAVYTKAHLGIDILARKMDITGRRKLDVIIYTIVILFSLFILVIGGWRLVDITFTLNQISPAMGLPMGYVYIVLPLTGILIIYYSLFHIIVAVKKEDAAVSDESSISVVD
jgi:TRAP-type C4-dicarboxylate transport system permease small subunit